jgi:hypothetical protein
MVSRRETRCAAAGGRALAAPAPALWLGLALGLALGVALPVTLSVGAAEVVPPGRSDRVLPRGCPGFASEVGASASA